MGRPSLQTETPRVQLHLDAQIVIQTKARVDVARHTTAQLIMPSQSEQEAIDVAKRTFIKWFRCQSGAAIISCFFLVVLQPIVLTPLSCIAVCGMSAFTCAAGYYTSRCKDNELDVMRAAGAARAPPRPGRLRRAAAAEPPPAPQVPALRVHGHGAHLRPRPDRHAAVLQGVLRPQPAAPRPLRRAPPPSVRPAQARRASTSRTTTSSRPS